MTSWLMGESTSIYIKNQANLLQNCHKSLSQTKHFGKFVFSCLYSNSLLLKYCAGTEFLSFVNTGLCELCSSHSRVIFFPGLRLRKQLRERQPEFVYLQAYKASTLLAQVWWFLGYIQESPFYLDTYILYYLIFHYLV